MLVRGRRLRRSRRNFKRQILVIVLQLIIVCQIASQVVIKEKVRITPDTSKAKAMEYTLGEGSEGGLMKLEEYNSMWSGYGRWLVTTRSGVLVTVTGNIKVEGSIPTGTGYLFYVAGNLVSAGFTECDGSTKGFSIVGDAGYRYSKIVSCSVVPTMSIYPRYISGVTPYCASFWGQPWRPEISLGGSGNVALLTINSGLSGWRGGSATITATGVVVATLDPSYELARIELTPAREEIGCGGGTYVLIEGLT